MADFDKKKPPEIHIPLSPCKSTYRIVVLKSKKISQAM